MAMDTQAPRAPPLLAALVAAGVLERRPGRPAARSYLRVSPRFLAHAEAVAARSLAHARGLGETAVVCAALAAWDEFAGDPWKAAAVLTDLLEAREQWGRLRPVFPLESFASVAGAAA